MCSPGTKLHVDSSTRIGDRLCPRIKIAFSAIVRFWTRLKSLLFSEWTDEDQQSRDQCSPTSLGRNHFHRLTLFESGDQRLSFEWNVVYGFSRIIAHWLSPLNQSDDVFEPPDRKDPHAQKRNSPNFFTHTKRSSKEKIRVPDCF